MRITFALFVSLMALPAFSYEPLQTEERLAMLPDLSGLDPCNRVYYKAEKGWKKATEEKEQIINRCRIAKYNCNTVKESFSPILDQYKAIVKRCERGEKFSMREVDALPEFTPLGSGMFCCFGFEMPALSDKQEDMQ